MSALSGEALSVIAGAQLLLISSRLSRFFFFCLGKTAKASATFVGFGELDSLSKAVVMFCRDIPPPPQNNNNK